MNINKIFAFGAVSALIAIAPGINADEVEVKGDVDLPKTETRTEITRDRNVTVRADADADSIQTDREKVRASNKASGLLGMEVRNNENEKLGEIKDLVLDLNSGKLSYAVLAVGGFLGIGEKLVALPPSALTIADDNTHLKLDADKSRIQAAPGFAATAWPSVEDPDINAFWKSEATGAPGSTEIRRRSGSADVEADVNGELKVDSDKKRIYTDADDKNLKIEVEKD
jgi:sporulation protein YlmC with PRC-barrel domain